MLQLILPNACLRNQIHREGAGGLGLGDDRVVWKSLGDSEQEPLAFWRDFRGTSHLCGGT